MRSRYTAYTLDNIDYIKKTQTGRASENFNYENAKAWAKNAKWLGLKIIDAPETNTDEGIVEFVAKYKEDGKAHKLAERSHFKRINGKWYYV